MIIRSATEEDCRAIATVQVNSYRTAYASLMPAEYLAAFSIDEQEQDWITLLRAGRELLLVAQNDEGQVIGYALSKRTAKEEQGYDCELVAMHINRDFHRQGAGRLLLAETARRMHTLGCRSLGLWVLDGNPACGFYEHLGGMAHGEQFFEIAEFNLRRRVVGYLWEHIEDLF